MAKKPLVYTTEECREMVLDCVRYLVDYWDSVADDPSLSPRTQHDRMSGLAFSILAMLDGSNSSLPGFIVAPIPSPDSRKYPLEPGEKYWPENHKLEKKINSDIAGHLHDDFYQVKKTKPKKVKTKKAVANKKTKSRK